MLGNHAMNRYVQRQLRARGIDESLVDDAAHWLANAGHLPLSSRLWYTSTDLARSGQLDGAVQRPPVRGIAGSRSVR